MLEGEHGGSIVITGSANAVQPQPSAVAYTAAKHGIVGLMRTLAWELGQFSIRVNCVNPGGVDTKLLQEGGTVERAAEYQPRYITLNRSLLPTEWHPPQAISDAVLWLASDESRYVTGTMVHVDSGWTAF
jgi:NAD(P)-dependent dehydrogenase (short-subunit alcohol dehydrogenase family)